ncbi:hypothetical protein BT69DRAFT_1347781 [Atractiella rhizophila]|nr:hypothetical protein BT69DRAFT_1347781 [Atractiella rhizophila]
MSTIVRFPPALFPSRLYVSYSVPYSLLRHRRHYNILALESSADDTCAAVLTSPPPPSLASLAVSPHRSRGIQEGVRILSSVVLKQGDIHEKEGGINPLLALWRHQAVMPKAIQQALEESNLTIEDVDAVAYTRGPGMGSGLSVCSLAARTLVGSLNASRSLVSGKEKKKVKLVGVHHMQAHALTVLFTEEKPPNFPFLTLLLSGGHTLLVLALSSSRFRILMSTIDEAIGNTIDMVSRALNIPWSLGSGSPGAALEAFVQPTYEPSFPLSLTSVPPLPIAMRGRAEFSFSGLRSSTIRLISSLEKGKKEDGKVGEDGVDEEVRRLVGRRFVDAAFGQVEQKVVYALRYLKEEEGIGESELGGLVVSGGVASNLHLRNTLRKVLDKNGYGEMGLYFPPPKYCTDNAAMIAYVALDKLIRGKEDEIGAEHRPKWSIEECED